MFYSKYFYIFLNLLIYIAILLIESLEINGSCGYAYNIIYKRIIFILYYKSNLGIN